MSLLAKGIKGIKPADNPPLAWVHIPLTQPSQVSQFPDTIMTTTAYESEPSMQREDYHHQMYPPPTWRPDMYPPAAQMHPHLPALDTPGINMPYIMPYMVSVHPCYIQSLHKSLLY